MFPITRDANLDIFCPWGQILQITNKDNGLSKTSLSSPVSPLSIIRASLDKSFGGTGVLEMRSITQKLESQKNLNPWFSKLLDLG